MGGRALHHKEMAGLFMLPNQVGRSYLHLPFDMGQAPEKGLLEILQNNGLVIVCTEKRLCEAQRAG